MKHENNFLLYAIGSAFLLVSSIFIVDSHFNLVEQERLSAAVVRVTAVVPEHTKSESSISGFVRFVHEKGGVENISDVSVFLISQNEPNSQNIYQTTKTDMDGLYVFSNVPQGTYFIDIEKTEMDTFMQPNPFVSGFSDPAHTYFVSIDSNNQYVQNLNFDLSDK